MGAGMAFLFAVTSVIPLLSFGSVQAAPRPVSFTETIIEDDAAAPEDPWLKTVGDINGDGQDDLVVGGNGSAPLVWYESPSWTKHTIDSSDRFTTDGEVADIDGDGDQDIVALVSSSSSSVRWYENPGDPTQTGWAHHTVSAHTVHDVEVADLDQDGKADILTRNQSAFSGDGDIVYIHKQITPTSWTESAITSPNGEGLKAADVDADGDTDFIVNGSWFENPGTISDIWAEHAYSTSWTHPHTIIAFADINNDERDDIILTPAEPENTTYRISWFEAPADRTQTWAEHTVLDGVETVLHFAGAADFNQDGYMDLASAEMSQSNDDDEVFVLLGNGGSSWEKTTISTEGSHSMRIFDANGDGYPDLFGANWRDNGRNEHVKLFTNNGTPGASLDSWTYIQADDSRDTQFFGLAMKDMTNDGYKDILSGKYFYKNPGGDMTGSWQRATLPTVVDALMTVNVDDDGLEDFIAMDSTGKVYWFEAVDAALSGWNSHQIGDFGAADHNISAQGFAVEQLIGGEKPKIIINLAQGVHYFTIPAANPEAGNWPRTLAAELSAHGGVHQENFGLNDFDGDSDLDIAVSGRDRVYWYENPGDGSGSWTRYVVGDVFPGDAHVDRTAAADMNSDGTTDIVLGLSNDSINGVYWYESPTDPKTGTWTLHEIVQQNYTNNIDLADMDFDGDTDIISAEHRSSTNSEKLAIWENDGAGNFTEHVVDTGKESHGSALTSDLDNDGDLDIVSIAWDEFRYLHVWRNDALTGGQPPVQPDVVDIWHGNTQTFGDKGTPQNWINILGTADSTVTELSYTLNGGTSKSLSLGPDERRLAGEGDFNIDIATADLTPGSNTVVITATDSVEGTVTETVIVNFQNDQVWTLPYTADWSAATQISDAAQVVDGPWELTPSGLRSSTPAYDRLAAIGDISWTDYEVTVPVTINEVDFAGAENGSFSGTPAVGLIMRWAGHTDTPASCEQPKCGWEPLGQIGWWRWDESQAASPAKLGFYGVTSGSITETPAVGTTYMMKQRVETQPDGTSIYSMKTWEAGQAEPSTWDVVQHEQDTSGHLASGSLGLIAHHVDATYGNVTITPIEQQDTTPPEISNVTATNITEDSATITWDTNEAADSKVEYGTTTAYGSETSDDTPVTAHSIELNGLSAGTTYHYRVTSTDAASNTTTSQDFTFTTAAPDTTAPVISNVASNNITTGTATITWDTDEAATSQVEYGLDTNYGSSKTTTGLSTQHSVVLDSLAPGTTYHYRVISEDAAGNPTTSEDFTFTTDAPDTTAPVISNVASSDITAQTATITWNTDEASDSQVEYGTTTAYGNTTLLDTNLTTMHSVGLSGLAPETTYHYRVISADADGNGATSEDHTFTTPALPPSLEAHWQFDETSGTLAADASGNGRDSTLEQGASFASGHLGNAVAFDGNDDYVDAGSFDITGQELTISTWINPAQFTGKYRDNRILAKATSDAEQDHYWMLSGIKQGDDTVLRFRLKTDGDTTTLVANTGNIPLNQWSHAVARYDGSTMTLYLNGQEVGSTAKSGELSTDANVGINIGRNPSGYGPWNGMIDDVRIYSRALTAQEIQDLFDGTTDTTAPVISNVASTDVSHDSATVVWNTDEAADSQVEYGTDSNYGNTTPLDDSLVTAHSVNLSGLAPETTYHFRVISRDAAGNESVSNDFTFDTPAAPDTTAPQISDVESTSVIPTEATITWSTDEPASTQVEYGTDTSYGTTTPLDTALVTSHSAELNGLTPETTYHYRVISVDAASNEAISAGHTFTTPAAQDTTPPEISNVTSNNVSHESTDITWDTDEPATTQVEYGTTTNYGSTTTLDANLVTAHSAVLTGLTPETEYHYRVISTDAASNTTTSEDFTFTTAAAPDTTAPVISNVASSNVTVDSATITWGTDEPADTQVEYGLDTNYGTTTPLDSALTTGHSVELTGLDPGTTYHYRVLSRDGAGNPTVSDDFTFTTEVVTLSIEAGDDQTVTLGQAASLGATADYNGQSALITSWTKVSGPGTVTFDDPGSLNTQAIADAAGSYVLRITVTDGTLESTDTLTLTVNEATADPGLIAHWLFDETSGTLAADASGNGNNATLQQGASFASGHLGNAVAFDGNDDYVDAGSLDVTGQALTLSTWINPAQFTGRYRDNRILSKATTDDEQDHYWMLSGIKQGDDTVLRFRLKAGGVTTTLIADTGDIPLNQWSHVTATYDGSTMRLYLNGEEVGSTAKSGEISTNPNVNVRIGSNPSGYGPWNGHIDDVRIYSRALSASEIRELATQ
jgi:phosphodiesterase/alkaline phosphatase D-like protein